MNSNMKGKKGELEVVRLCCAEGYETRRSAQYCENSPEGTADVVGLPGVHIEVKRVEHLNIDDAPSIPKEGTRERLRETFL